jgi:hypothetical protein
MNIRKLNLLEIRRQKFQASRRQIRIEYLLKQRSLRKDSRKALMHVLILLTELKISRDELEGVSESLQQTIIHGY